jgi:hypothetical protein
VSATSASVILIWQQHRYFNYLKLPSSNKVIDAIQYEVHVCHTKLGNQLKRMSNIVI